MNGGVHVSPAAVILFVVSGALLFAQAPVQRPAPDADARFEVASIRRNASASGSMTVGGQRERWIAVNATPLTLVMNAYPYETFRILGAPAWMSSERYDVNALGGSETSLERRRAMLKTLLAERFNFLAHTETRQMQTYALVLARGDGQLGPQLKPWTVDCEALRKSGKTALPPPRSAADFAIPPPCGMRGGRGVYAAGGTSLASFTYSLASELSAPVTDHTGLKGDFEIVLRWNPDPSLPGADPSLPALFTAIQEQLGLRLEPRREPAEVLVIDRVDRPTPD